MSKLVKCPVCGKKYLANQAISNHINKCAEGEAYKRMLKLYSKKDVVSVKEMPHFMYKIKDNE